jgi:hypothetical protein
VQNTDQNDPILVGGQGRYTDDIERDGAILQTLFLLALIAALTVLVTI